MTERLPDERLEEIRKLLRHDREVENHFGGPSSRPSAVSLGEQLLAEVDRHRTQKDKMRAALEGARDALEAIMLDEATIEAGLWRGDMIPRKLRQIEEALGDGAGIVSIPNVQ